MGRCPGASANAIGSALPPQVEADLAVCPSDAAHLDWVQPLVQSLAPDIIQEALLIMPTSIIKHQVQLMQ